MATPKTGKRRDGDKPIMYLTDEELRKFFAAIKDVRDRAIFQVIFSRGLRASEIEILPLTAFDPRTGVLKFTRKKGSKGGEAKTLPAERAALKAWLKVRGNEPGPLFPSPKGGGIKRRQVYNLMAYYGRLARLPKEKCHPHILKHSIACALRHRGEDVMLIQKWLGHAALTSTAQYLHVADQEMQDASDRLARGLSF